MRSRHRARALGGGILLTIVQQLPILAPYYTQIRGLLYLLLGTYAILSIRGIAALGTSRTFRLTGYSLFTVFLFVSLTAAVTGDLKLTPATEVAIPFGILLSSFATPFTDEELARLLRRYVIFAALLALVILTWYGTAVSATYVVASKNQIGPILGTAAVIALHQLCSRIHDHGDVATILSWLVPITLLVVVLAVMRNRAGFLALLVVAVVLSVRHLHVHAVHASTVVPGVLVFVALALLHLRGVFKPVYALIWGSLTANYDITDPNSISAGRFDGYLAALAYVAEHPVLGGLAADPFPGDPHNFILQRWVLYGLVGSFPLVLLYLHLWRRAVRSLRARASLTGPWTLLVGATLLFSLLVSIVEYSYPLGPGVSQIMLWFLVGQDVKKTTTASAGGVSRTCESVIACGAASGDPALTPHLSSSRSGLSARGDPLRRPEKLRIPRR